MIRKIFFWSILTLSISCQAQPEDLPDRIVVGAERMDQYLPDLKNKNVGLVVNQSSLVGTTHLLDTLLNLGIKVPKLFTPEHGFKGTRDAGEIIDDELDEGTGQAIISLYGDQKKPSPESLQGLDLILFDLQDVGVRFYTYISTLHLVMEACAENNIPLIVLDRPNPNGDYIDGPVLDTTFSSFVGMHPIPVLHGMTIGELGQMINGEKWLANGVQSDLKVISIDNYTHDSTYVLPVKPSPNLPNYNSIRWYPSLCFFEGTRISIGRGTYFPFEVAGFPDPSFGEFEFTPVSIEGMSKNPKHQDKTCYGVDLRQKSPEKILDLSLLIDFYGKFEKKQDFFIPYFNTLAGTDILRKQIESGMSADEIRESWQKDLENYRIKREKYLLYP